MTKNEIRKYCLNTRKNLSYDSSYLKKEILNIIKDNKNIAIYYPLNYEISLLFLKDMNLNLIYPRVNKDELDFYKNPTKFLKSKFNVLEPLDGIKVNKEDIDIMFVPCLATNSNFFRIGYGKGYYDRYLKNRTFKAYGICYKELCIDFKEDIFDERLDGVIICNP